MKKLKLALIVSLLVQVMFGSLIVNASETQDRTQLSSDITAHWAKDEIAIWQSKGVIKGYPDGSFKPNQTITRAEFVQILNQVFNVEKSEMLTTQFTDLDSKHWAYAPISYAIANGYISGTSKTTVSPNSPISRQEAAVMISRLLNKQVQSNTSHVDYTGAASWSKAALSTLVGLGIMQGDKDGKLNPTANLTRAEAVVLIDKTSQHIETVFTVMGTYGNEANPTIIDGDVRITAAGVKLLNTVINGDLIIDKQVGEGDVYLHKVEIKGDTIVQGGGENSIHLEDSIILKLIADKATGTVRIVAIGSTVVQEVFIKTSTKLEESKVTNTGFKNVQLTSDLPDNAEVQLLGNFEDVNIIASNIKLSIPSGKVNQLNVDTEAEGTQITVSEEATILALLLNVATQILGEGSIEKATIAEGAKESSFTKKPVVVDGDDSKLVIMPSTTPPATGSIIPPVIPPVTPPVTPEPTPVPSPVIPDIPADESSDATLHAITVTNDVYVEWIKESLLKTSDLELEGFDRSHFSYLIYSDWENVDKNEITFKLTHDPGANVTVYARDYQNFNSQELTKNDQDEYSFTYTSDEITYLDVYINSENLVYFKSYRFTFLPKFDVNDTAVLTSFNGSTYGFNTGRVQDGDIIDITIPKENSTTDEAFTVRHIVSSESIFHDNYVVAYVNLSEYAPVMRSFKKTTNKGKLYVNITRNGKTIFDGDYNYDLTPHTVETLDEDAYTYKFLSQEEIREEELRNNWSTDKVVYSYRYELDLLKLQQLYGEFKYFNINSNGMALKIVTVEDLKKLYYGIGNGYDLNDISQYDDNKYRSGNTALYNPLTQLEEGIYYVHERDIKTLIGLFNEDKELIKVVTIQHDIPESALGEHVQFKPLKE